ncbi:MAG: M20 family metallopeptidase [Clostridia bacterium]|nr:M20 family metallopeptidase [Clostridia bacterium]
MELNEYLKELEYLVNIDSDSFDPDGVNKVASYFSDKFKELGWIVKEYEPADKKLGKCLVCVNRISTHYDLLAIGHMDTVFKKGTCAERPFKIIEGKAFGPGVADMKHGSLMMYYLFKELPKEVNDNLNIVAIFNPDEEIGSVFSKTIYADYAKISDYAFVYETSMENTGACSARKGSILFEVEFIGKSGHSAYVDINGAVSAIHEMGRWITKFDAMNNFEIGTTVNVGLVSGGVKPNVVADNAKITIDIRYKQATEYQRFMDLVDRLTKQANEKGIKINLSMSEKPPFIPNEKAIEYINHVERLAKENGFNFNHSLRGGVSDANFISQYGAICLDGLGPTGAQDHSENEYMVISSVIPYFELSKLLIKDLADKKTKQL